MYVSLFQHPSIDDKTPIGLLLPVHILTITTTQIPSIYPALSRLSTTPLLSDSEASECSLRIRTNVILAGWAEHEGGEDEDGEASDEGAGDEGDDGDDDEDEDGGDEDDEDGDEDTGGDDDDDEDEAG